MSVDLDIFPTTKKALYWKDIRAQLENMLGPSANRLLGMQPKLRYLGSDISVREDEALFYPKSYYLDIAIPNTLALTLMPNKDNLDEQEYLEDYGRNLTAETIRQLTEEWATIGYYCELNSTMGRGPDEPWLFTCLALAIANTCNGHIIVMQKDIFNLGGGVYTVEEFSHAIPTFRSYAT